jgi:hypothetical protein
MIISFLFIAYAIIERHWLCYLLGSLLRGEHFCWVLHCGCSWGANYFLITFVLDRCRPDKGLDDWLNRLRNLWRLLFDVERVISVSPLVARLLVVYFPSCYKVLLILWGLKLFTRIYQLIVSVSNFFLGCISFAVCFFANAFLLLACVQDLAFELTFLELYSFLAFVLEFLLLAQIEEPECVSDEALFYFEIKGRICCKTRCMVNFQNPRLKLFI